jgi:hypothetical protein
MKKAVSKSRKTMKEKIVNKMFYIKGDKQDIFDVGMRPGILGKAKGFSC